MRWLDVLAYYAASVALNSVLPPNLGTPALLVMFWTILAGATFAAILGAYAVEKILFTLVGGFTSVYVFRSVGGPFAIKFCFVRDHPWATAIFRLGGGYLIFLLVHAGGVNQACDVASLSGVASRQDAARTVARLKARPWDGTAGLTD